MKDLDTSGAVSVEEQNPVAFQRFLNEVGDQPSFSVDHHHDSRAR